MVTSYGKHWNFICRVKLQDILEGGFDSGGERPVPGVDISQTEYEFSMKLSLQYANGTIEVQNLTLTLAGFFSEF